jgi:hypothetical protein
MTERIAKPFNFHNDPTYHWYVFVRAGLAGDVKSMVAEAMTDAGEEGFDEFDDHVGLCHKVCLHLAAELEQQFDELTGAGRSSGIWKETVENVGRVYTLPEIGSIDASRDDVQANLRHPLLQLAAEQIDHQAVAQAILRDEGKWNPEKRTPRDE